MSCKNCSSALVHQSFYCNQCGAKIVSERITIKRILEDAFQNYIGWDNKYLVTITYLILRPGVLLREYYSGTRKKFLNPFAFLTIGMAINLFVFNSFDEEFISVMNDFNKSQLDWYAEVIGGPFTNEEFQSEQLTKSAESSKFMLKYFNILVILLLPVYTLMAFLIYRKPYNYAEHIVANCYIQGFSMLTTSLIFFIAIWIHPSLYLLIYPLLILYYTYVYGKLYKLTIGQSILKIILFLAILTGSILAVAIISVLIGIAIAYILGNFK
ncbi:DUF3667 domain-containing protein [Maribacter dokdonensis]|uniref:DUF3667 domain-containing protein n=1 Tax=Maribacter dokdonensis TaxID=320912 RepID=UPI0032973ACD